MATCHRQSLPELTIVNVMASDIETVIEDGGTRSDETTSSPMEELWGRDQREWVFEIREVKSKNKKLSLFCEKCKVKKKCCHSFSRSGK